MQRIRRAARIAVPFFAIFVLLAACGDSEDARQPRQEAQQEPEERSVAEITITATDESIEMPPSIGSAPTLFVLENEGTRPYEAKFARLNEGVTIKDLKASLRRGPDAVFSLITLAGELRRTAPGESNELTTELAAGHYVVVDPKYVARGMVSPFEVVATTQATEEPEADVDVTLTDFAIDMPTTLPSGPLPFKVANQGGQAHEFLLLREGEKPGPQTPGVTPFNPGSTVWVEFDLQAGKYTAVCYFLDTKTGKSHAALGMKTEFIVE